MRRRPGLLLAGLLLLAAQTGDPLSADQYALDSIRAVDAWPVSRGSGAVIAIVDSGVDLEHPDLMSRFLRDASGGLVGRDLVDGDGTPQDVNGHGTMVAGIAAATAGNDIGIAGVAPEARIMPIRVLDEEGGGRSSDVDEAIRWAVDNGADVVNLSIESALPLPGGLLSGAPTAAVDYAWGRGVAVVAAAGNSGSPFTDYPASSPVLLVGATNSQDRRASFSDTGRRDAVMAPGVAIVSTWWCTGCPDGPHTYGRADGTSFAAPHVSGAVAVLLASGFDAAQAVQRLRDTARDLEAPGPDSTTGHGLIDVAAAVGAGSSSPPPPPSPSPAPPPSPSPPEPPPPAPRPASPRVQQAPQPPPPEPAPPASPAPSPTPRPSPSPSPTPSPPPDGTVATPGPLSSAPQEQAVAPGPLRALAAALVACAALGQAAARRWLR